MVTKTVDITTDSICVINENALQCPTGPFFWDLPEQKHDPTYLMCVCVYACVHMCACMILHLPNHQEQNTFIV